MSDEKIINYPLEIPFKDFMPGQVIQSGQFNDDMAEIEEKVNEVVEKHNTLTNETDNHISNKDNPHEVTAHQVGTYSEEEIDAYLEDIRNGGLYDKSIENRVLDDECVEARNIKNASITSIKVDSNFGSQINISKNIDITDRYTKKEVNDLLTQKVGEGTYSKEELDQMFEDVQAGQIVDGTIDVSKLKDNVGKNLNISTNPSITERYTKSEVDVLIQENGLPKDWGNLGDSSKQVQLRGGSSNEHQNFLGKNREITIDTDLNTVRVHDGQTRGGHILSKKEDVDAQIEQISSDIESMMNNIGSSHNHDDKYSKLDHNHDSRYYRIMNSDVKNVGSKYIGNYPGLCTEEGYDDGWYRTTTSGLIPYQSGGYSSIGTDSWRFAYGYFVNIVANTIAGESITGETVNATQLTLPGGTARNQIKFANNDYISFNDNTNDFDFLADDNVNGSRIRCGHIELNGKRIYIGSSFPSDARVNDILIQI